MTTDRMKEHLRRIAMQDRIDRARRLAPAVTIPPATAMVATVRKRQCGASDQPSCERGLPVGDGESGRASNVNCGHGVWHTGSDSAVSRKGGKGRHEVGTVQFDRV